MAQFALFENVSLDGDGSITKDLSPNDYVEILKNDKIAESD